MNIINVKNIIDNDKHVLIITKSGCVINLPVGEHSITIRDMDDPSEDYVYDIKVDLYHN